MFPSACVQEGCMPALACNYLCLQYPCRYCQRLCKHTYRVTPQETNLSIDILISFPTVGQPVAPQYPHRCANTPAAGPTLQIPIIPKFDKLQKLRNSNDYKSSRNYATPNIQKKSKARKSTNSSNSRTPRAPHFFNIRKPRHHVLKFQMAIKPKLLHRKLRECGI